MHKKQEKDFLRRGLYSWNKPTLHASDKTNKTIHDFFISKSVLLKKIRSISKEDVDRFFEFKKFRFVSKEDTNQFFDLKNSDLHLMKMQINFFDWKRFRSASNEDANQVLIEKDSDPHLMKIQISFWLRKIQICI